MKPKASAARKIAAFRMPPYIRRPICSQLGFLLLGLTVLALPLAGIRVERAPILTPLATELVPLGTSLQSPASGYLICRHFLLHPAWSWRHLRFLDRTPTA